jgi:hypothetical protein
VIECVLLLHDEVQRQGFMSKGFLYVHGYEQVAICSPNLYIQAEEKGQLNSK